MTAEELPGDPAGRPGLETGSAPATPDDPQQLREEIERTREQLGQTVEQLAARVDVKSRARAKAAELQGRTAAVAVPVRQTVAKGASTARQQRVPLAVAAGVMIAVYLAVRQWRKR